MNERLDPELDAAIDAIASRGGRPHGGLPEVEQLASQRRLQQRLLGGCGVVLIAVLGFLALPALFGGDGDAPNESNIATEGAIEVQQVPTEELQPEAPEPEAADSEVPSAEPEAVVPTDDLDDAAAADDDDRREVPDRPEDEDAEDSGTPTPTPTSTPTAEPTPQAAAAPAGGGVTTIPTSTPIPAAAPATEDPGPTATTAPGTAAATATPVPSDGVPTATAEPAPAATITVEPAPTETATPTATPTAITTAEPAPTETVTATGTCSTEGFLDFEFTDLDGDGIAETCAPSPDGVNSGIACPENGEDSNIDNNGDGIVDACLAAPVVLVPCPDGSGAPTLAQCPATDPTATPEPTQEVPVVACDFPVDLNGNGIAETCATDDACPAGTTLLDVTVSQGEIQPTCSGAEEPTATPTEEPTVTPTEEPTATPTEEPTTQPAGSCSNTGLLGYQLVDQDGDGVAESCLPTPGGPNDNGIACAENSIFLNMDDNGDGIVDSCLAAAPVTEVPDT